MRRVIWVIMGLLWAVPSWAEEARCTELGANCICSEPLNMTSFTTQFGGVTGSLYYNPNDSTVKQCSYEVTNFPFWSGSSDLVVSTDATALSRLPVGHSNTRFVMRGVGESGGVWLSSQLTWNGLGGTNYQRVSTRGYVYHTNNYNFVSDTPGCHSKFLQGMTSPWHFEDAEGNIHMYEFSQSVWGPSPHMPRDCCYGVPGSTFNIDAAGWKGRWIFFEAVLSNLSGPGWRAQLYMKDVTNRPDKLNGGNEWTQADTFGTTGGPEPWTNTFNQIITSSPRQGPMQVNFFRGGPESNPSYVCAGTKGLAGFMVAGWTTNAGQRIGASSEIEGGGGPPPDTTPPAAPTGVTIAKRVAH